MAGFTISMANGFNDSLYGKSMAPITMCLEKSLENFEQQSVLKSLFNMKKSNKYAEKMISLSAMNNFSPVGENGAYVDNDYGETFSKVIEHYTWKSKFEVTREMIEESNVDLMKIGAEKFAQAYHRTRELFGVSLLTGATTPFVEFSGKKWDTTGADKVPLFSKSHPNFYKASKTQSNLYSTPFSLDALSELEVKMQQFKGEKDELLSIAPDTIVIPNIASLKKDVFAAIGADKDPITANNAFNYQYGRWNVIICNDWNVAGTDKPFILMDSKFNQLDGTALFFDRIKLAIDTYEDHKTDAAVYQGRSRFSVGFNNWRGMLMGGTTGGTVL